MNLFYLSWKNLSNKWLPSALSLSLLSLSVGLISLVALLGKQLQQQFTRNIAGIDMVVGAKGSPLQLILSAVYQIDSPTGNIDLAEAEKIAKNSLIKKAIQLAYGDSYKGFRIIGCATDYDELYNVTLREGKIRQKDFEVNIGSSIAEKLGLKIGDTFQGTHGLQEGADEHEQTYQVVGIFSGTGTVIDQLILCSIESVWAIHDDHESHEHEEHNEGEHNHEAGEEHNHEEHHHEEAKKEITALLLQYRSPMAAVMLPRQINENTNMQAALPAIELNRLFTLLGTGIGFLQTIAFVIMIVAGISIFVALYNSLQERRYELALMRTIGASRWQLAGMVMTESLLLTCSGLIIGLLLSRLGLNLISKLSEEEYGYSFDIWQIQENEILLIAACTLIGLLAALLPAWQAYRINISTTLAKH